MRILLIEDDKEFAYVLKTQLSDNGFEVDVCHNGSDGIFYVKMEQYHLILLDRMLPVLNGTSFLDTIRSQNISIPVIFITGLGELHDKVYGLNHGADDYLVKPFAFEELLARIHCILRRPVDMLSAQTATLSAGDLFYKLENRELTCKGGSCILTAKEGALLELFLRHPNVILSREMIFSEIWGNSSEVEYGNVDNFIYFLRNRFRAINSKASIKTLRGKGYGLIV